MKAVVKYKNAANATELREVPVPEIGPTDCLVEVAYVGVCGTDPHMHRNTVLFDFNCPFIFWVCDPSKRYPEKYYGK